MVDFFKVHERNKKGVIEVYPRFIMRNPSKDLMIKGGDFYAIWLEDLQLWSTREQDVIDLIDAELDKYVQEHMKNRDGSVKVLYMKYADTGTIDDWHKYCQKQMRDNFHMLDEKIIFSNQDTTREDYASKKLKYPLEDGDISGYEKLIGTLYSPKERHKLEWAIGSIVSGESKFIQKFIVLYGEGGTGKSTFLHLLEKLFEGYCATFDAKALGSASQSFALEPFKTNPLVAIQHDGDLSKIEDNTRLNSLVSHESMTVNEKFRSAYTNSFKAFLFMGTNKPVKITDSRSGLIRRLIDVSPSGNLLSEREYNKCVKKMQFELGSIAQHCLNVYMDNPSYYNRYKPLSMMGASNDFYNFMLDNSYVFEQENATSLSDAWTMYGEYCDHANVNYKMSMRVFKEELKTYFSEFEERHKMPDGSRIRNYYSGLILEKFESESNKEEEPETKSWIDLKLQESIFDKECSDCKAQEAVTMDDGTVKPMLSWNKCKTTLKDIDTTKIHYVQVPLVHIIADFDKKDKDGNKNLQLNIEAASTWPETYCEVSKSGQGLHLHYIYTGDNPEELSREYEDGVEIKVNVGNSSLRRQLTLCNDKPISKIGCSGLLKKRMKHTMIDKEVYLNETGLITTVKKCLNKEIPPHATVTNMDFLKKITDEYFLSGKPYDISSYSDKIFAFAASSSHNKDKCLDMFSKLHLKSETEITNKGDAKGDFIFFDCEVFPNLLLINWKKPGENSPMIRMINPTSIEVQELVDHGKLIGFNCRRYDNHILYARILGKTNEEIYKISKAIVSGDRNAFFGNAYNLSYTDIYDFCSKKQSLKKWEIELGLTHKELGMDWDKPVPEEKWIEVSEYCDNDVISTEALFNARQADFLARRILADIAGLTVNDTTNSLTTRIIFGNNKNPQGEFCYRNLAEPVTRDIYKSAVSTMPDGTGFDALDFLRTHKRDMLNFVRDGMGSLVPFFPGYKYEMGISTYRGEEVGEGGYVYAEPGIYGNVALLDIASMHPSSIVDECLFGPKYTTAFNDILTARIYIKHKEYDKARQLFGGKLAKYLTDDKTAKDLAQALKIAINSVYGLTDASFSNPFRDPRNKDNIVAKRGALFMVDLKHEVQKRGFIVAHIKTDSIKIPDATPEIIQFVIDFGKKYGYNFEHEATYERMCLVNDAVYIAKYKDGEHEFGLSTGETIKTAWTATGTQFQIPYVFKKLFAKADINFEDMCETKSVSTALYLDNNEPQIMKIYETFRNQYDENLGENVVRFMDIESYLPLTDALRDFSALEKALKKLKYEYKDEDLHNYKFVGKVGRFCPVKVGKDGGLLVREKDGKYHAAAGSKGYRWIESWLIKENELFDAIDTTYYEELVIEASKTISTYGDLEWFISDDPYVGPEYKDGKPVYMDEIPWDVESVA